jgi:5-(carboxyamino)imidazole ribonucleotide synthase
LSSPILPGSTIGVLGSGQLGRMFAIAARRMGYRVHTFSPETDTPTGQVADVEDEWPFCGDGDRSGRGRRGERQWLTHA